MLLAFSIIAVFMVLCALSILKAKTVKPAHHKLLWSIAAWLTGALLLFSAGSVLFISDYYSARRWVAVIPIVDASSQHTGSVGFSLPSGHYLIEVDREGDVKEDDGLIIKYVLTVPREGLKIDRERKIDFNLGLGSYRLDGFVLKKDKSNGVFSVDVLKPSKSKISVKLVTDRYFDL